MRQPHKRGDSVVVYWSKDQGFQRGREVQSLGSWKYQLRTPCWVILSPRKHVQKQTLQSSETLPQSLMLESYFCKAQGAQTSQISQLAIRIHFLYREIRSASQPSVPFNRRWNSHETQRDWHILHRRACKRHTLTFLNMARSISYPDMYIYYKNDKRFACKHDLENAN